MDQPNTASASTETRECPECGKHAVRRTIERQSFKYGEGKSSVEIAAEVPVWECSACHFAYTDDEGERARHNAVCRHLGVLSPEEINALRNRHNLTQAQLARLTGIGEASIKRWESGTLIQNVGSDRLLRTMDYPGVIERLRELADGRPRGATALGLESRPRFRTEFSEGTRKEATIFSLRRTAVFSAQRLAS